LIYVYAIAMRQLTADSEVGEQYFPSIPRSMYTLLLHGTLLDDLGPVCENVGKGGAVLLGVFFSFIALAALMVMNMLIGVLCEVVSAVAATEKEDMTVCFVHSKLKDIIRELDQDGNMTISVDEFEQILSNPIASKTLQAVGVDPIGLIDFKDFIFDDGSGNAVELEFVDFMKIIMETRGSQCATVKDMMDLNKVIRQELKKLEDKMQNKEAQRRDAEQSNNAVRVPSHINGNQAGAWDLDDLSRVSSNPNVHLLNEPTARPSLLMDRERSGASATRPVQMPRIEPLEALLTVAQIELSKIRQDLEVSACDESEQDILAWKVWANELSEGITKGLGEMDRVHPERRALAAEEAQQVGPGAVPESVGSSTAASSGGEAPPESGGPSRPCLARGSTSSGDALPQGGVWW